MDGPKPAERKSCISSVPEGRAKKSSLPIVERQELSPRESLIGMLDRGMVLILNVSTSLSSREHGKAMLGSLWSDKELKPHLKADFGLYQLIEGKQSGWRNYLWHYERGVCTNQFYRQFILSRKAYFARMREHVEGDMDPDFASQRSHLVLMCPYGGEIGAQRTFILDVEKSILRLCLMSPRQDEGEEGMLWLIDIVCKSEDAERLHRRLSGSVEELFGFFLETVPGFAEIEGRDPEPFLAFGRIDARML